MSEEQENPATTDHMEQSLKRLRKRITYIQDEMQITSFAIKAIERDLEETQTQDEVANENA